MADDLQRKIIAKVYSRVSAVVMGLCDEGDRVYFGTSNDADILRDLRDEWDAHKIMGEDILSSEQEVAALRVRVKSDADRVTALQAQNRNLVEKANELLKASTELAQYASYAEMVGGISVNRTQVRKWCDEVFDIRQTLPEDENFEPTFTASAIAEAEKGEG